jgi:DNA-binding response OmpR family regulator
MRILVVDDDDLVRELLREILVDGGHDVIEAANAKAAYASVDQDASPGLVITDVNLGAWGNGFDVARYARDRLPDVLVIVISAIPYLASGQIDSPERFMQKPFEGGELLEIISEMDQSVRQPAPGC